MFNLLCIGLHVFLYNTIKWPYQPKHSPSMHCNCIKMRENNKESNLFRIYGTFTTWKKSRTRLSLLIFAGGPSPKLETLITLKS